MRRHSARLARPIPKLFVVLAGILFLTAAVEIGAECSEVHQGRIPNPFGNHIRVIPESAGAPVDQEAVEGAIAMWTGTCSGEAPVFGRSGNIVMRLRFHDGPNDVPGCGDGCACTISNTLPSADGEYLASAITHLFERHRDGGGYCRWHREETIAHEIGHVLGFRHPDDPYSPECAGLIMSFSPNRSVRPADCRALTALWRPPFEPETDLDHLRWLPGLPGTLAGDGAVRRHAEAEEALEEP